MAIRPLTQTETNTLVVKLTLAGYVPGRDFKFDDQGRLLARKEVFAVLSRMPALPEPDEDHGHDSVNAPQPTLISAVS